MTGVQYGLIAIGGALGALARFGVGTWIMHRLHDPQFPWGTFVINITGSLLLGFVATLLAQHVLHNPNWKFLINIGFVGAYTTFSTFEYESARLSNSWQAMCNLLGSVVTGYIAVMIGIRLALLVGTLTHRSVAG